jgi:hypothetical protein
MDACRGNREPATGNETPTAKTAGTWDWGLGTGGGMSGSSDAAAYANGCGRALAYVLQAGRPRVNPVPSHEAEDRR